ncbi:DUF6249 domain-containing protein [Bacteroidota bacterium]
MVNDILISLGVFAACFGIVYVAVTAKNRERLAMIAKDMNPFEHKKQRSSNTYALLKWSLLIIGLGFGVFIGSLFDNYTSLPPEAGYFGAILFFGGLGLLLAFLLSKKKEIE